MFEQMNQQMIQFGRQTADAMIKAQGVALESFERALEVQMKAVEGRVNAASDLFSELSEARDADSFKSVWPKGFSFVKETTEAAYGTSQELVALSLKTSEALAQIAKGSIEAANEGAAKVAKAAAPKAAAK